MNNLTDILRQNGYSNEDIEEMSEGTIEQVLNLIFDAQNQGGQPPSPPTPQPTPVENFVSDINGGFDDREALNIAIALSKPTETTTGNTTDNNSSVDNFGINHYQSHHSDSLDSLSLENSSENFAEDSSNHKHDNVINTVLAYDPPDTSHGNLTKPQTKTQSNNHPAPTQNSHDSFMNTTSVNTKFTTFASEDSSNDFNPVSIENFDESSDDEHKLLDTTTKNRMIIQEQDREYHAAQRLAQEAELLKEKEHQDKQLELDLFKSKSEEIINALLELPPEPNDKDRDTFVKIAVQFPAKRRETRNFLTNELGKDVYIWVSSLTMDLDINDPGRLYLDSFELVATTRTHGILDKNRSLKDQCYTENTLFMIDIL